MRRRNIDITINEAVKEAGLAIIYEMSQAGDFSLGNPPRKWHIIPAAMEALRPWFLRLQEDSRP
jgi:hypothetical protein